LFGLLIAAQIALSLYSWVLIKLWAFSPEARVDSIYLNFGSIAAMAAHGATNVMAVVVVTNIAYFLWVLTQNPLLGFMGSIVLWIAGILKPVWLAFLIHAEGILYVFTVIGWLLNLVIPSFHSYDLWLMRQEFGVDDLTGFVAIKCIQTALLSSVILYATWKVASIKRT
jgi:hypothetical protein